MSGWRGAGPTPDGGYGVPWLDLRAAADAAARSTALAERLGGRLRALTGTGLRLCDVGTGTGAMPRWLAPRLPGPQHWTLVEPDGDLLAVAARRVGATRHVVGVSARAGALGDLSDLDCHVLTCSALLDVLGAPDLARLAALAVDARAAVLAALTVTGRVGLSPGDPRDPAVVAAHAAHQLRGGAGAAGAELLAAPLRAAGWQVSTAATPWRLPVAAPGDAAGSDLLQRWLDGFAAAAAEQRPELDVAGWLALRRRQAAAGGLRVVVGHVDLLAVPPGPGG